MAKITYNKLVRDRIPEIIQSTGKKFEIVTMSSQEYEQALLEKLLEEATELVHAPTNERIKEMADLQEVIKAIQILWEIDLDSISNMQQQRANIRGAFKERIKLLWVEEE